MCSEINARDRADRDAFQKVRGFGRLNRYDRARLGGVRPLDRGIDNRRAGSSFRQADELPPARSDACRPSPRASGGSRQFEPIVLRERIDVDPERMNGRRYLATIDVLKPHETNGRKLSQGACKVRLCAPRHPRELGCRRP